MNKVFIISGNHNEFLNYQRKQNELLFSSFQDIVYVSSVHVLKGYREPHGMLIGTWYRRKDIEELVLQLQVASSITPEKAQRIMNEYKSRQR